MSEKNAAAVALGKRRWKGVGAEERAAHMSDLAKLAARKMTAKQRLARAKKASLAAKKARKRKSQVVKANTLAIQSEKSGK